MGISSCEVVFAREKSVTGQALEQGLPTIQSQIFDQLVTFKEISVSLVSVVCQRRNTSHVGMHRFHILPKLTNQLNISAQVYYPLTIMATIDNPYLRIHNAINICYL